MKWPKKKVNKKKENDDNVSPGQRYNEIRDEENKNYLRSLLAEKRPPYVQERILNVLVHEESTIKKINIVEKVDKYGIAVLDRREKQIKIVQDAKIKKSHRPRVKVNETLSKRKIEVITDNSVVAVERGSFFQYFFTHWKKISAYGRMTSFIKGNMFKRRHEATDKLVSFWNKDLKNIFRNLKVAVEEVLEDGWKDLSVIQYNLVAHLLTVIEYFFQNELLIINKRIDNDFFTKTKGFIDRVLTFSGKRDEKDVMIDGITIGFEKLNKEKGQLRQFIYLVEKIFDPEENLFRSILALNMIYRRKFLFLDDLNLYYTAVFVSHDGYNCTAAVQEKIDVFIRSQRKEYIQVSNDLNLLSHLEISDSGELTEDIFKIFITFYYGDLVSGKSKDESYSMVASRLLEDDMKSFLERFISNFRYKSFPLLNSSSGVSGRQDSGNSLYFDEEIARINFLFEKLANRSVAKEGIVVTASLYNEYLGNKDGSALSSKTEEMFFELFVGFGKLFYDLSMKLLIFIREQKERVKGVRHDNSPLSGDLVIDEKYFMELDKIQKAALGAAYILKEERLYDLLLRKSHLEERLFDIDNILLRMS